MCGGGRWCPGSASAGGSGRGTRSPLASRAEPGLHPEPCCRFGGGTEHAPGGPGRIPGEVHSGGLLPLAALFWGLLSGAPRLYSVQTWGTACLWRSRFAISAKSRLKAYLLHARTPGLSALSCPGMGFRASHLEGEDRALPPRVLTFGRVCSVAAAGVHSGRCSAGGGMWTSSIKACPDFRCTSPVACIHLQLHCLPGVISSHLSLFAHADLPRATS